MSDAFSDAMGDRRGSGRLDPLGTCWWRALESDPRGAAVAAFLDDAYARGLRWIEIVSDPKNEAPRRAFVSTTDGPVIFQRGDRDHAIDDDEDDLIADRCRAGELIAPPSSNAILAGWLWEH
jgi:hypothetical protein